MRFTNHSTLFILVDVDDINVTEDPIAEIQTLVSHMNATFSLKDLGDLHYFLGIEVVKTSNGLHLSQKKYILELLKRAKMDQANTLPTLMFSNLSLSSKQVNPIPNPQITEVLRVRCNMLQ